MIGQVAVGRLGASSQVAGCLTSGTRVDARRVRQSPTKSIGNLGKWDDGLMNVRAMPGRARVVLSAVVLTAALTGLAACGNGGPADPSAPVTLRLGHFPNLTHASADRRRREGHLRRASSARTSSWRPSTFNAGPAAIEALFAGASTPRTSAPTRPSTRGRNPRARPSRSSRAPPPAASPSSSSRTSRSRRTSRARRSPPRSSATPRTWRCATGSRRRAYATTKEGGGDVKIMPQDNAVTVDDFRPARSTAPGCRSRPRPG